MSDDEVDLPVLLGVALGKGVVVFSGLLIGGGEEVDEVKGMLVLVKGRE
jgi:hypothetical protein